MLNHRTCGECALMKHNGGVCPVFNQSFDANEPGCPKHALDLMTCELCGGLTLPAAAIIDLTNQEEMHFYCDSCRQHVGHCPTCKHAKNCLFETDPSSLPKAIQREIRQGNMVQIMTVKNPERIRQTCQKGCPCFSEEFGCLRQFNSCGNYKIVYED